MAFVIDNNSAAAAATVAASSRANVWLLQRITLALAAVVKLREAVPFGDSLTEAAKDSVFEGCILKLDGVWSGD